ncbi:golgin subfamily A member 6-like protein 2 isoform X2 [Drosophila biarmipes]|uniref:golgin subfamily A member 6-like protein 2 isoform X2 n=1 Tax=Drosophila biarmipes TaxID=125945 RepID=UPI0021CC542B|nr:golgin subfamily A member 6-like protein 2 isoform X2 [Drosophila biarmipes]
MLYEAVEKASWAQFSFDRPAMENLQVLRLLLGLAGWVLIGPGSVASRPGGAGRSTMELQSHYLQAITAYRRLERVLPKEELRAVTGIGLLNGARQAEEQMEQHLVGAVRELLFQMNLTESARVMSKIDAIEQQLSRDQRALEILNRVMDVVSQAKDDHAFRVELREMAQQQREEELYQQELSADLTDQPKLGERLGKLRRNIIKQVPQMKNELEAKIEKALQHLLEQAGEDGLLAKAKQKVLHKRQVRKGEERDQGQQEQENRAEQEEAEQRQMPQEMRIIKSILSEADDLRFQDDFQENMLDQPPPRRIKLQPDGSELDDLEMNAKAPNVTAKARGKPQANAKPEKQVEAEGTGSSELAADDADDEAGEEDPGAGGGGGGGGGLVGIIGSLSGGEGGSDVGALIGALTGLVSTLFGPGGLDVQGLIQTGTSLISGLLGGNKNFGLVLGQYVGTALDGLSGGGGADPDEEGPPQPLTFTKNLITSFLEAKFRPNSEEGSEERHGSAELPRPRKKKEGGGWAAAAASNFDSGGFVKQVASHLVSNALGLILNAGLGAAGGASSAAKNIFASSSMGHHAKPADHHHRSWSPYDHEPF